MPDGLVEWLKENYHPWMWKRVLVNLYGAVLGAQYHSLIAQAGGRKSAEAKKARKENKSGYVQGTLF